MSDVSNLNEALSVVLEGQSLDSNDLDLLRNLPEGEQFDVKSGLISKPPRRDATVRQGRERFVQSVLSFANSRGGLLLLGIDDQTRDVDGWQNPVDPRRWVDDLLQFYRSRFIHWPSVTEVAHDAGTVAVVAVAPSEVPIRHKNGDLYLRRGQESVAAEDYLVRHLLTGRFRSPAISLEASIDGDWPASIGEVSPPPIRAGLVVPVGNGDLNLTFGNDGLVWARDLVCGTVWPMIRGTQFSNVPAAVERRLEPVLPPELQGADLSSRWALRHEPFERQLTTPPVLSPFHNRAESVRVFFPEIATRDPWSTFIAVYALCENDQPRFWEVELRWGIDRQPEVFAHPTVRPRVGFQQRQAN